MRYYYVVFSVRAIGEAQSITSRTFFKIEGSLHIGVLESMVMTKYKTWRTDLPSRQLMEGKGPLTFIIENYIEMTEADYRVNVSKEDW